MHVSDSNCLLFGDEKQLRAYFKCNALHTLLELIFIIKTVVFDFATVNHKNVGDFLALAGSNERGNTAIECIDRWNVSPLIERLPTQSRMIRTFSN